MRQSLLHRILFPFFLAVVGGFVAYGAYYWYVGRTRNDSKFIEIAGMQAVRAEQIGRLSYTLALGFEWARESLSETVDQFDVDLGRLEEGDDDAPLDPAPVELKKQLSSLRDTWVPMREHARRIAALPAGDESSESEYESMRALLPRMNEAAQGIIQAAQARIELLRGRISLTLGVICLIDIILIAIAFWMLKNDVISPLLTLESAARRAQEGDLSARVAIATGDELSRVGSAFNEMASSLDEMIERHARTQESLRILSGKLMTAQDDERRRLAREIHDSTVQSLGAASMRLGNIAQGVSDGPERDELASSRELVEKAIHELRSMSYLLHPPLLERSGLVAALEDFVSEFSKRSGIDIRLDMSEIGRLSKGHELTLFRVVQEGLSNIQRHAESEDALIRLYRSDDRIVLEISDSGRGVDPEKRDEVLEGRGHGVGIAGMRERVVLLGGELTLESSNGGTSLKVSLPVTPPGGGEEHLADTSN